MQPRRKWEEAQLELYDQILKYSRDTNSLHPFVLCKEVHDFLYKGDIDPKQTVTGWGGNMIGFGCMRWLRAYRPGQEVTVVYQFGPMGPDLAMMMGPAVAVQRGIGPHAPYKGAPVVVVTGDAGMAYSLLELDTFVKYKLPVICIVYNNDCWGTFTMAESTPRALHMYLFQENLRYDKMAENLGTRGEYVRTPEELRAALKRSYDAAEKQGLLFIDQLPGDSRVQSCAALSPRLELLSRTGCGSREALILQKPSRFTSICGIMQEYADRGIFRSFSSLPGRNGIAVFKLVWFWDLPFELVVDTRGKKVLVPVLLPQVPEDLYKDFKEFVRSHHSASLPEHRRIDKARVTLSCARRHGNACLTLNVKDEDFGYGLQRLIHLIHETFVIFLADGRYRDYAVAELGADSDW